MDPRDGWDQTKPSVLSRGYIANATAGTSKEIKLLIFADTSQSSRCLLLENYICDIES